MTEPVALEVLEGVTLPSARLLGQAAFSLALAEADEPELAGCGWSAFRTESLRRQAATLEAHLTHAAAVGTVVEDALSVRVYDVFRRARDLSETIHVYAALAFHGRPELWPHAAPPSGPGSLSALAEAVRALKAAVERRRDELMVEGLHPMVSQRLELATCELEWAGAVQDAAVARLSVAATAVAALKGRIFQDITRLNRIGALAYRHDATHRARYNIEILDCRQPALSARPQALRHEGRGAVVSLGAAR